MLQLTVQFIHLFAANLMFKGMILVPVILRMIYVNTRFKDFFRATFFNQSKIKQKLISRKLLIRVFPRKEPATFTSQSVWFMWLSACFLIVSVITCTLVSVQTCDENSTLFHCSTKKC